ncbi:MAG TPA: hypothetical protein PKA63_13005 [Oligoflexia bacterium]|nr:hypothetical protein [Oligoflexia bacterium]HMP49578.1 hypothetical protein [Oligoflexia bacterium]
MAKNIIFGNGFGDGEEFFFHVPERNEMFKNYLRREWPEIERNDPENAELIEELRAEWDMLVPECVK